MEKNVCGKQLNKWKKVTMRYKTTLRYKTYISEPEFELKFGQKFLKINHFRELFSRRFPELFIHLAPEPRLTQIKKNRPTSKIPLITHKN